MTKVTETDHDQELAAIAASIMKHVQAADESVLRAAKELVAAKTRIERGDFGAVKWSQWSSKNLGLAETRIRELLKIGRAKDPMAELQRQRDQNNTRQKLHRAKKAIAASVSNRPAATSADAALHNAAEELITWAATAPEEHVRKVLAYIATLGAAAAAR